MNLGLFHKCSEVIVRKRAMFCQNFPFNYHDYCLMLLLTSIRNFLNQFIFLLTSFTNLLSLRFSKKSRGYCDDLRCKSIHLSVTSSNSSYTVRDMDLKLGHLLDICPQMCTRVLKFLPSHQRPWGGGQGQILKKCNF